MLFTLYIKATGEPAVTMSISVLFALRHAINSVRADNGDTKKWYRLGKYIYSEQKKCRFILTNFTLYANTFRYWKYTRCCIHHFKHKC